MFMHNTKIVKLLAVIFQMSVAGNSVDRKARFSYFILFYLNMDRQLMNG